MALKLATPFPLFAPQLNPYTSPSQSVNPNSSTHRPAPGEVRFSRWNNANAERFEERRRTQKEIEDEIRIQRRFNSAARIADTYDSVAATTSSPPKNEVFRSVGTPSSPSNPSIPGKKSKYSKNPSSDSHPAFRRLSKTKKRSIVPKERPVGDKATVGVGEDGVSFSIDGAPFEYMYSYTETPKVKPIKLREPAFAPFGPTTMARPWTGRAPLPPSKKKLKEFDSFRLPPPNKKGVKPVQAPGPFLPGSGPKYVKSREEIMGEPLTKEEVAALVKSCLKTKRQLNMGRDGLTHNMLDNIHAHWKRRRVCKIKCKGVCTVDMDNVREQLEERTGGKIIFSIGGVLYLFRGRNYNYRTRPRFPLMLWKPITPVYPRLIRRVPEGLTLDEASEMRMKGRSLLPITRLGKNGVYSNLVAKVREAFEACELVRINCEGMNGSDFRKIGAKLKDLVPCVLISFENEHILMWRGRNWKSSFPTEVTDDNKSSSKPEFEEASAGLVGTLSDYDIRSINEGPISLEYEEEEEVDSEEDEYIEEDEVDSEEDEDDLEEEEEATMKALENMVTIADKPIGQGQNSRNITSDDINQAVEQPKPTYQQDLLSEASNNISSRSNPKCAEGIRSLLHQAVENGSAVVLEEEFCSDADVVYRRVVALAESAPPGPVFKQRPRKEVTKQERATVRDSEVREEIGVVVSKRKEKSSQPRRKKDFGEHFLQVVPPTGSLGIDELAKLLA